jgi:hypothetical protein
MQDAPLVVQQPPAPLHEPAHNADASTGKSGAPFVAQELPELLPLVPAHDRPYSEMPVNAEVSSWLRDVERVAATIPLPPSGLDPTVWKAVLTSAGMSRPLRSTATRSSG